MQVVGLGEVVAVSAGVGHGLAVQSNGTVWAWGSNEHGQLGDGTTIGRHTPVEIPGFTDVIAIDGAYWHSLAVRVTAPRGRGARTASGSSVTGQQLTGTPRCPCPDSAV